jgi:hypothetical protein
MAEEPYMENGKNELDVRVVSDAVIHFMPASFAESSLLHSPESSIQNTILDWKSVRNSIQVLVCDLEFGELHDLLIREE